MDRVLVTWIGMTDLRARDPKDDPGPVLRFLQADEGRSLQTIYAFNDVLPPETQVEKGRSPVEYIRWAAEQSGYDAEKFVRVDAGERLRNDMRKIWSFTVEELERVKRAHADSEIAFLLSPGYPAAVAALMVASETLFGPGVVRLFNASVEAGVERVALPFELTAGRVLQRAAEARRAMEARPDEEKVSPFDKILGSSAAIQRAKSQARRLAVYGKEFHVLILGDRGTGKDLFARAMHESSPRKSGPFIALNCAAIQTTLARSELFGAEPGAATGVEARPGAVREADGGTLFLDEIGLMPPEVQGYLLRFLQDGSYLAVGKEREETADVWVIAATNKNLDEACENGQFPRDLLDRLSDMTLHVPPLRQRLDDVPQIAAAVLAAANESLAPWDRTYVAKRFAAEALRRLQQHVWPGNVRELRKVVRFLAFDVGEEEISADDVKRVLGTSDVYQGYGLPLGEASPSGFMIHLTAAVDELLARYEDGALPVEKSPESYDLREEILEPLLFGRAVRAATGNKRQAGLLLRRQPSERAGGESTVDLTKAPNARSLKRYHECFEEGGLIDEEQTGLVRFGSAIAAGKRSTLRGPTDGK